MADDAALGGGVFTCYLCHFSCHYDGFGKTKNASSNKIRYVFHIAVSFVV